MGGITSVGGRGLVKGGKVEVAYLRKELRRNPQNRTAQTLKSSSIADVGELVAFSRQWRYRTGGKSAQKKEKHSEVSKGEGNPRREATRR